MIAAKKGSIELLDHLLKEGANPHELDANSRNSLFYAVESDNGENPNVLSELINSNIEINHSDKYSVTPLSLAVESGCVKLVELLIENGADSDWRSPTNDSTLIDVASQKGSTRIKEILETFNKRKIALENLNKPQVEKSVSNDDSLSKASTRRNMSPVEIGKMASYERLGSIDRPGSIELLGQQHDAVQNKNRIPMSQLIQLNHKQKYIANPQKRLAQQVSQMKNRPVNVAGKRQVTETSNTILDGLDAKLAPNSQTTKPKPAQPSQESVNGPPTKPPSEQTNQGKKIGLNSKAPQSVYRPAGGINLLQELSSVPIQHAM